MMEESRKIKGEVSLADRLSNVKGKIKKFLAVKKCMLTLTLQNAKPAIIDLKELSRHRYVLFVVS